MSDKDGFVLGNVTRLVDHGAVERRFNIVFLGDGFQLLELPSFIALMNDLVDRLRITSPLRQFWPLINLFRIDVVSTDSGITHLDSGVVRKTFFDARATGRPREVIGNDKLIHRICRARVPAFHQAVVIVNDGSGLGSASTNVALLSARRGAPIERVVLHELGHSAFGLADEYDEASDPSGYFGEEPAEANATKVKVAARVKWRGLGPSPLVVVPNPSCGSQSANELVLPARTVGVFEGARHVHCGLHRPSGTCTMRLVTELPCVICRDKMETELRKFRPVARELGRSNRVAEPTLAVALELNAGTHVLSYSVLRGEGSLLQVSVDSQLVTRLVLPLTLGWSSIVALPLLGGAHVLLHNAVTGRTEISKVADDGSTITTIFAIRWTTGWSSILSFVLAGRTFLFSYKELSGRADIDRVDDNGNGTLIVFSGQLEPGFTAFAAIERVNPFDSAVPAGGALLAGYQATTGTIVLFLIGERGTSLTELMRVRSMPFGTSFVGVTAGKELVLAIYNALSGEVRWVFANDMGEAPSPAPRPSSVSLTELGTSSWSLGWNAIAPFERSGRTHWFASRSSDGTAVLEIVD